MLTRALCLLDAVRRKAVAKSWELRIRRIGQQQRGPKLRTVGKYQVFHDGAPVAGLSGSCAETRGPGDNNRKGNNRCVATGTYPLSTQDGERYCTLAYTSNKNPAALRRPALLLLKTNKRVGILLHPARGFLWSVGCINPAKTLANELSDIDFADSRTRVIAIIDDLIAYLGGAFPAKNGKPIPNATIVIS
jgi:hypothetical protein